MSGSCPGTSNNLLLAIQTQLRGRLSSPSRSRAFTVWIRAQPSRERCPAISFTTRAAPANLQFELSARTVKLDRYGYPGSGRGARPYIPVSLRRGLSARFLFAGIGRHRNGAPCRLVPQVTCASSQSRLSNMRLNCMRVARKGLPYLNASSHFAPSGANGRPFT